MYSASKNIFFFFVWEGKVGLYDFLFLTQFLTEIETLLKKQIFFLLKTPHENLRAEYCIFRDAFLIFVSMFFGFLFCFKSKIRSD